MWTEICILGKVTIRLWNLTETIAWVDHIVRAERVRIETGDKIVP